MSNEKKWAKLIAEWGKSGKSQNEWCREKGIKPNRFWYWKKKL